MTTTITSSEHTIIPTFLMEYSAERASRNVIHNIIGKAEPDVSLELDGLRSGTLNLFFESKVEAWAAFQDLGTLSSWELTDTDHPEINMNFVREGPMTMELDPETRKRWVVGMDYQEVI